MFHLSDPHLSPGEKGGGGWTKPSVVAHQTCPALLAFAKSSGNQGELPPSLRHGSNFPSANTQSCASWWNATPSSLLSAWTLEPLECIRFQPQGGEHLGNMVLSPQLHSSYFHLIVFLSYPAKFHSRPAQFPIPQLTFFFFLTQGLTMEEHVRARFEFLDCFPAVECFLCVKAQSRGETFNLMWPFTATQAWVWLTASTRAREIQIRNLFYPQWHNHWTYPPFQKVTVLPWRAVVLGISESLACVIQSRELWQWKIIWLGWG